MTQSSVKQPYAKASFAQGTKELPNLHTSGRRTTPFHAVTNFLTTFGEYILHTLEQYRQRTPAGRVGILTVILSIILLVMPADYIIEGPGPAKDVLGTVSEHDKRQIIEITGQQNKSARTTETKSQGQLLMTTVNSFGIGSPISNADVLANMLIPISGVLPREAVIAPTQTVKDFENESAHDMSDAQTTARTVALQFAQQHGIDTSNINIAMHIDDIGGPSAGMMYTLGVLQKLSTTDLTGGKIIAGTGTIDANGKVGPIGGIQFKMIGARKQGAIWFLAPTSNCSQVVGHIPDGLRVVSVGTLDEAYQALRAIGQGKGQSLPECAVQ